MFGWYKQPCVYEFNNISERHVFRMLMSDNFLIPVLDMGREYLRDPSSELQGGHVGVKVNNSVHTCLPYKEGKSSSLD